MQKTVRRTIIILTLALSFITGGCSALRPVRSASSGDTSTFYIAPTKAATATPMQSAQSTNAVNTQPADCTNILSYEKDLTLPDGTHVNAGSSLDKQWQVKNSGTCNWDKTYTIRMLKGDALGAASPQTLDPVSSGAETTIHIHFTAPSQAGNYTSSWQAYDPDGEAFGDYFSIEINVTNP